jgi:hypothetical protein
MHRLARISVFAVHKRWAAETHATPFFERLCPAMTTP